MAGTRTETVRINRHHALTHRVTRMHRHTTIVEAAARTKLRRGLTPHQRAVTRRQRALIPRHLTRRLPDLTLVLPTQRLRVPTPRLAAVTGAAEARVAAEVVEAALTVEAVVGDRMVAALTEAVRTDAKISGKKSPLQIWGGLFCAYENV